MDLRDYFSEHPRVAVGLSGGTDSAFLAWAAARYAEEMVAVIARTPFMHDGDMGSALSVCGVIGIEPEVVDVDLTADPGIMANPPDRCYLCKRRIFSAVIGRASELGFGMVADGTNASDDVDDRPGFRALRELGVASPLRECGLTKEEIRRLSREAGLPTWDLPSESCLATRMVTGLPIDMALLRRADEAEEALRAMGYSGHRVRVGGPVAMVRLAAGQLPSDAAERDMIIEAVEARVGPAAITRSRGDRMEEADYRRMLEDVAAGRVSVEDAVLRLKREPFEDLGYAKIDHHRGIRQGVTEVVYGAGKTPEQVAGIAERMLERNERVMVTRLSPEAAEEVSRRVEIRYDPVSRIALAGPENTERVGKIAVITAGTSDIPVAEEAAVTAEALGNNVVRIYDSGVSGIHRLLAHSEDIMTSRAVIAVAGMEGALASVVGGMADCPVIAVPTSVGYGASFGGLAALLAMLNSCSSGVSVVNIDNGFGAGYLASMINRRGE